MKVNTFSLQTAILLVGLLHICQLIKAQPDTLIVESSWSFSPGVPSDGVYETGTEVQVCVSIPNIPLSGAQWWSGFGIELPEGWDYETLDLFAPPFGCGGNWIPLNEIACNDYEYPPGYYHDDNVGGPQDGTPCNNWGDSCPLDHTWQFCFSVSIEDTLNPNLLGANITPSIWLTPDNLTGSWICCGSHPDSVNTLYYAYPINDIYYETNSCGDQGVVDQFAPCDESIFDLNQIDIPIDSILSGFWYYLEPENDPVLIEDGLIDPSVYPSGVYSNEYEAVVNDTLTCNGSLRVTVDYQFPLIGTSTEIEICGNPGGICPSEFLENPVEDQGTWFLYDSQDSFIQQFSQSDFCIEAAELSNLLPSYEHGFSFVYFLTQFPCGPYVDTLDFNPNGPFGSSCSQLLELSLENTCLPESAELELYDSETGEWIQTYESSGLVESTYSFEISESGNYDLYLKVSGFLNELLPNQTLGDGNEISFGYLIAGDFNADNSIGIADFSLFASAYGLNVGDDGFQEVLDIDCSNSIGIGDFSSFSSNYGLDGDQPE